jgi:hypothetical protein
MLRCSRTVYECLEPVAVAPDGGGPADPVAVPLGHVGASSVGSSQVQETVRPDHADVRRAEERAEQARALLQRARDDQARASSIPEALELFRAQREVSEAKAMVERSRLDLERLNGPNPASLTLAERTVQRAEATLRAIRSEGATRKLDGTEALRETTAADAERALQEAVAQRDRILQPPSASEVDAAHRAQAAAQLTLEAAARCLDAARQRYGPLSVDEADAAVVAAQIAVYDAEASLRALDSGRLRNQPR